MMQAVSALNDFFSGFGLPVYPEGAAPTEAAPPYITVQLIEPDPWSTIPFYARVWYRSRDNRELLQKTDEISRAVGPGAVLQTESGAVWIYRDSTFAQLMPFEGDPDLKCMYLRFTMQANTE